MTQDTDQELVRGLARLLGHELGEIAALFDGYLHYLDEPTRPDAVAALRRTTERLRNVCDGLFELAEIAASPVSRSAFDPVGPVAAARERLRARGATSEAEIDVRIRSLPNVVADRAQLEQLFMHVLRSAAMKASSGKPVVVVGSREGADVRLDVGVDPLLGRDPAEAGGRSLVGQGMDLALSSQIAERNGGRLWVTSSDRSGPTISLTLPAA